MADAITTVGSLRSSFAAFVRERDWDQFHNPKNLCMGLSVEAAELMEHFLWVDNEGSRLTPREPGKREAIADEIADVACYLLAFCNVLDLDLSDAIAAKLVKNTRKYPAEAYRGRYRLGATHQQENT